MLGNFSNFHCRLRNFKINFFQKILSGTLSESNCLDPDQKWQSVQTVWKGHQHRTKVAGSKERFNRMLKHIVTQYNIIIPSRYSHTTQTPTQKDNNIATHAYSLAQSFANIIFVCRCNWNNPWNWKCWFVSVLNSPHASNNFCGCSSCHLMF